MGLFDGKTEFPTQKRREDAKKKGQFAKSRDLISVAVLVAGFASLRSSGPQVMQFLQDNLTYYLTAALSGDRTEAMLRAPLQMTAGVMLLLAPLLVAVSVAALVGNVAQTGPVLLAQGLKWDFTKLNPVQGVKRFFSAHALAELLKSLAKIGVVGWVVGQWLRASYEPILQMGHMELMSSLSFAGGKLTELIVKTVGVLTVIAAADYAFQKFQHERSLMMTRQEVRDEIRQQEGSPEIRGAIRRRQREIARGRMMANVPKADVVVTNPTHYAVALKYDPATMAAPVVVAKGQRLLALRIRELATEHRIPIVENPPLARSLFAACDLDSEVPPELYAAVAEVLAYVYRLTGKVAR